MGESFGRYTLGSDEAVTPYITSANIACGLCAGDPIVMNATIRCAVTHGVSIGAHPGFPDLQGFGRREMNLTPDEIEAFMIFQIGALAGLARAAGADLVHVKPDGALYNMAARDIRVARAVARAVARFSKSLVFVGLSESVMIEAGAEAGLRVAREAFADRAYNADGSLVSRTLPGAVLESPQDAATQAVRIALNGVIMAHSGEPVALRADTLCIHGDTPAALAIVQAVRCGLDAAGVRVLPMDKVVPSQ
jgi:UPF0271 protein